MLNVTLWWDTSWAWFFMIKGGGAPAGSDFIITEDDDFVITEDGDNTITE